MPTVYQRTVEMSGAWLHFPVASGAETACCELHLGRYRLHNFRLSPAVGEGSHYYPLYLPECEGRTVTLTFTVGGSEQALRAVRCGGAPEEEPELYPDLYREPHRPRFHYSVRRGWLNDPNGLFYRDGVWHLYYQHNPLGPTAVDRNCSWGHATSRDLFHWEEQRPALMPTSELSNCASGSCLADTDNVLGYGSDAVVAAFTALGVERMAGTWEKTPARGQYLAVSTDGGYCFRVLSDQPTVPCERGEPWRDPCLFRDGDGYGMAVYETFEGQNTVSFYRSDNLRDWRRTGRAPELFECPDLFPLTCEETGETKWALFGGDGQIRVGEYNGRTFLDSGDRNPLDFGRAVYAGQTWRHAPNGRRIHIGWACGMGNHAIWDPRGMGYEGLPFSQCMTVPCELKLHRRGAHWFVSRTPVEELRLLYDGPEEPCTPDGDGRLALRAGSEYRLEAPLGRPFALAVADLEFCYSPADGILRFPNGNTLPLGSEAPRVRLLADETTVEIFWNDCAAATYTMPIEEAVLHLPAASEVRLRRIPLKNIHSRR